LLLFVIILMFFCKVKIVLFL